MRRGVGEADYWEDQPWEDLSVSRAAMIVKFGQYLTSKYSKNLAVPHSPDRVQPGSVHVPAHEELPPAPVDGIYDKWFFISGAAV